eukprot:gene6502-7169_t
MARLERRLPAKAEKSFFLQYAKNLTSQGGEDGILQELFQLLDIYPKIHENNQKKPFCIDVGAWDGKHLSNTYTLLHDQGWSGILFEAHPDRSAELRALYNNRSDILCLQSLVDLDGENALPTLLAKYDTPLEPDFLSIDVDGADYHLWHAVGRKYRARVVCVEFNPSITNDVYFIQEPCIDVHQGASLLALIELGKELGYTIVVTTLFNAIFVRDDLVDKLPPFDNDINTLHIPQMSTSVFQTYDGELKFVGTKKLLWHQLPFNVNKLQVLSKREQVFPFGPPTVQGSNQEKITKALLVLEGQCDGESDSEAVSEAMQVLQKASTMPALQGMLHQGLSKVIFRLASTQSHDKNSNYAWMIQLADYLLDVANRRGNGQDYVQAERYYQLVRILISTLKKIDGCRDNLDHEEEIRIQYCDAMIALARIVRLQERVLEAWQLMVELEEDIDSLADQEKQSHYRILSDREKLKCSYLLSRSTTEI